MPPSRRKALVRDRHARSANPVSLRLRAMYLPKHCEEQRPEDLLRYIREYPHGILVLNGADGLDANIS